MDYFQNRFGGGKREWIESGKRPLSLSGKHLRASMFWSAIKKRAEELLEREARPGIDYALTEVVHCKSKGEYGVKEATSFCVDQHFADVMELSVARLVVALGGRAATAIHSQLGAETEPTIGPVECWGRERMIAFLPHPNFWGDRRFANCYTESELTDLRTFLLCSQQP